MPHERCPLASTADPQALSRKGFELVQAGDAEAGLACHLAATALPSANAYDWFHRARAEQHVGKDADATTSYERSVMSPRPPVLEPQAATEAYFQLGKLWRDQHDLGKASRFYTASIRLSPSSAGAYIMSGVTLRELGRVEESIVQYGIGLRLSPAIPAAQYNRAQALKELGRMPEAIDGFATVLALDPAFALAYEAMGDAHLYADRPDDATAAFAHFAALRPTAAAAHYSLGKAHFGARRLSECVAAHWRALALPEEAAVPHAYVHNDLGNALSELSGRSDEVLHHYSEAARLMPSFAEALSNVGTGLKERGRHTEAAEQFRRAIGAKPTLCEAYKNLGSSYGEIDGRLPEAVGAFEGALRINPQFWPSLYALLDTKQFLCDWRGRPALLGRLVKHLDALHSRRHLGAGPDERMHGGLPPFQTLPLPLPPATRMAITRNRARRDIAHAAATLLPHPMRWSAVPDAQSAGRGMVDSSWLLTGGGGTGTVAATSSSPSSSPSSSSSLLPPPPAALRLGLLTADFGDHPVGHALLPWVAALRARSGLEVICVASDSNEKKHPGSALRRAIAAACTAFYDVTELPDVEAALLINELRIHVLLNLVGHTAGARHVLTQWQPAPVQGLHYGYPATTALPAMGYMQVDRVATPPELQSDFTERLAYFPHCHFIAVHAERYPHVQRVTAHAHPWTGDRRVIAADGAAARRSDLGLGPVGSRHDAFALCNFNQLYKLDPETFEAWANALRRLPRAFLWLSRVSVRKDTSMFAEANLQLEAAALGIDTPRLAFSFRFGEKDYVPFRALADLMVDNRNYNAHTTGADTLWAGVPAVMIEGGHLAGRAGATFSSALGTASMLAESIRAYEDGTYLLGTGPARLHALRRRLLQKRGSAPFFDLARLARGQHRLATLMWGVYAAGLRPMHVIASR